VGTELLSGKTNTHVPHLSRLLREAGIRLTGERTVPDELAAIRDAVSGALSRARFVIVCGGLGPTFDDITRAGAAAAVGRALRYRPDIFARILRRFRRHAMKVPASNRRQAWLLEGARELDNRRGSAPGQLLELPGGRMLVLLPGPFAEMAPMFAEAVLPRLGRLCGGLRTRKRVFRFYGIAESAADERLGRLLRRPAPGVEFTILACLGLVDLHVSVAARRAAGAEGELARIERRVRAALGRRCFGTDGDSLESVAGDRLRARGWTLAAAESCTGGLLGERLTRVPGSSDYFLGSVVAYHDGLKESLLGVRRETLRRWGAVSAPVVRELAEGVRARADADCSVALTGIAGPDGGTRAKPVGLVFIAVSLPGGTTVLRRLFAGNRSQIRERAASAALFELISRLS